MFQPRIASVLATAMLAVFVVTGCKKKGQSSANKLNAETLVQKLVLDVDGKSVEIPLEKMDVNLVKRGNSPETFEIHGNGVALVGSFPAGVKIDYAENWSVLIGKAISISPRGGDRREPENSELTLPGGAPMKVIGGILTINEFGEGLDAKVPLTGQIEINCQTPQGTKTYKGTFAVNATAWG